MKNFKFFSNNKDKSNKNTASTSSATAIISKANVKKEVDELEYLQRFFKTILSGDKKQTATFEFEALYGQAYRMVINGRGSELYEGVRKIVSQHVKQMVKEFQSIRENPGKSGTLLISIDKAWFEFFEMMDLIRGVLLYSERVYENSTGAETIFSFCWRIFRSEVLENESIRGRLPLKLRLDPYQCSQLKLLQAKDVDFNSLTKSVYLDSDVMIEVMAFLKNNQIGLKLALVTRQLALISDYILNKRKHILRPIMICDGNEEENENGHPFAIPLEKMDAQKNIREKRRMSRILDGWNALLDADNRIQLPRIEPPQWITGVEFLYLNDGLNVEILSFLYSLRGQLKNCHLYLNLSLIWTRLHESNVFWSFLNLFNQCCFSLTHTDIPILQCSGCFVNENTRHAIQWPLWALCNNIFFSHCCELNIPIGFLSLSTPQNEMEVAKWLQHPSTEHRPRKLKFYTENQNWFLSYRRAVSAMVEAIKMDFENSRAKRTFFVEFPRDGLNYRNWGEWMNPIGEQLKIDQFNIKRVALEDGQKQFEDFYANLMEETQPKVLISCYKWVKKSVTPGTPVAVRRSNNPPTPVVRRRAN